MCTGFNAELLCRSVSPQAVGAVLYSTSEGRKKKMDCDRWATSLLVLMKNTSVCKWSGHDFCCDR